MLRLEVLLSLILQHDLHPHPTCQALAQEVVAQDEVLQAHALDVAHFPPWVYVPLSLHGMEVVAAHGDVVLDHKPTLFPGEMGLVCEEAVGGEAAPLDEDVNAGANDLAVPGQQGVEAGGTWSCALQAGHAQSVGVSPMWAS